tara:strand:- start:162 stop:545 length:384 start_codon:yes stop_codon:yes gene_type:complete
MDNSEFLDTLVSECKKRNVSPSDLVEYVIEAKEGFRITKRGLGRAAAILGVGALAATGTAAAVADTSQGIVTANKLTAATIAGPTSDIADLSGDIFDLSSTGQMVLPITSGTPGSLSTGSMWLDSSI